MDRLKAAAWDAVGRCDVHAIADEATVTIDDEDTKVAVYAPLRRNDSALVRTPLGRSVDVFAEGATEYLSIRGLCGELLARLVIDEHGVLLRVPGRRSWRLD